MLKRLALLLGATGLLVVAHAAPAPEGAQPVTSLAPLSGSNASSLAGQRVELAHVRVQRVLNPQVILLGFEKGPQVLVRRQETKPPLQPGQTIDVVGIVQQMPVTTQGWDLPGKDTPLLRGHQIFINALHIRSAPATK